MSAEEILAELDFHPTCEWDIENKKCVAPAGWVFWLSCCLDSATLCDAHMDEQRKTLILKRRNLLCAGCNSRVNQWIVHSLTENQ